MRNEYDVQHKRDQMPNWKPSFVGHTNISRGECGRMKLKINQWLRARGIMFGTDNKGWKNK
jgi:hypothetical protein